MIPAPKVRRDQQAHRVSKANKEWLVLPALLVHKARKESRVSRVCPVPLAPKVHRENKARRV